MKPKINIGYVSLFTLFLIVVIVVITGIYGYYKYQMMKFPEKAARGEIKNPLSYVSQIREKVDEILRSKDVRNLRSFELAEASKKISDRAGTFSLEVPESWIIIQNEVNTGGAISNFKARSSYYSQKETQEGENKSFKIEAGAEFYVRVSAGETKTKYFSDESQNKSINQENNTLISGGESASYKYKNSLYPGAEILEANLFRNGKTYTFALIYNPKNFRDADYTFREILNSVQFLQ